MISVDMFGFWLDLVPNLLFVMSCQRFILVRKFLMSVVIWVRFTLDETVLFKDICFFVGCLKCVPDSFEIVGTHGTDASRNLVTGEKLCWPLVGLESQVLTYSVAIAACALNHCTT